MKLLFVANRVPYPPYRGDKLKIFHLASQLAKHHELHLITIAESKADLEYRKELEQIFHKVHLIYLPKYRSVLNAGIGLFGKMPLQVAYFRSAKFAEKLNRVLESEHFDAVHVQHIRMTGFFRKGVNSNVILDLPDAFSLYWKRRAENAGNWFGRAFAKMEYRRLLHYEKAILPEFSLNLVCSAEDRDYLKKHTGAVIEVLPNGVDTTVFHPMPDIQPQTGRMLFTGNMDYEPNVDAVQYFCTELLPEIVKQIPGSRFVIAGQRPVPKVLALASDHVEVTGFVKHLAEEYARASVLVAPLRFGAGTQNKVLESLAMGLPVVCTPVGFKGLGIENGEGAVKTEGGAEFVAETVKLLTDEAHRQQVIAAGGDTIRSRFSWVAVARQLETYLKQVSES